MRRIRWGRAFLLVSMFGGCNASRKSSSAQPNSAIEDATVVVKAQPDSTRPMPVEVHHAIASADPPARVLVVGPLSAPVSCSGNSHTLVDRKALRRHEMWWDTLSDPPALASSCGIGKTVDVVRKMQHRPLGEPFVFEHYCDDASDRQGYYSWGKASEFSDGQKTFDQLKRLADAGEILPYSL